MTNFCMSLVIFLFFFVWQHYPLPTFYLPFLLVLRYLLENYTCFCYMINLQNIKFNQLSLACQMTLFLWQYMKVNSSVIYFKKSKLFLLPADGAFSEVLPQRIDTIYNIHSGCCHIFFTIFLTVLT